MLQEPLTLAWKTANKFHIIERLNVFSKFPLQKHGLSRSYALSKYTIQQCGCINTVRKNNSLLLNREKINDHGFSTSLSAQVPEDEERQLSTDVVEEVQNQVCRREMGRLFAVVHLAGKQRKVTTEDIIILDKKIEADIGEEIRLNKVLLVGGKDFTAIGRPILSQEFVKVEALVLEKTLSQTIVSFWYRKRKDWRRMYLRKNFLTFLRITNIEVSPKFK